MSDFIRRWQFACINGERVKRIITDPSQEDPDVWKESPNDVVMSAPEAETEDESETGEQTEPNAPDSAEPSPASAIRSKNKGGRPRKATPPKI